LLDHHPNLLLRPGAKAAHPFPTALVDALAGYTYLVDFCFKEEDIVVCGGSTGIRSILILFSTWTDMSESFEANAGESAIRTTGRDWATPTDSEEIVEAIKAFLGDKPDEIAKRCVYLLGLTSDSTTGKVSFKDFRRSCVGRSKDSELRWKRIWARASLG
jgi:hypothetical protein